MNKINEITINTEKFGKIIFIVYENLYIGITLEKGPRILFLGIINKNDLFNEIISKNNEIIEKLIYNNYNILRPIDLNFDFNNNLKYELIGGHRLWLAPENKIESYIPDSNEINFKKFYFNDNFLYIFSNIYKYQDYFHEKGFIISSINKIEDNNFKSLYQFDIINFCLNLSKKEIYRSLWGITLLNGKGEIYFPILKSDENNLNPLYNIVIWPYNDDNLKKNIKIISFNKSSFKDIFKYIKIFETNNSKKIYKIIKVKNDWMKNKKFGFYINSNLAIYLNKNYIFIKNISKEIDKSFLNRIDNIIIKEKNISNLSLYNEKMFNDYNNDNNYLFPDLFTNFQTYLSKNYIELESLSQIFKIEPNKTSYSKEKWAIALK